MLYNNIEQWYKEGVIKFQSYLIIVFDKHNNEYYPLYLKDDEDSIENYYKINEKRFNQQIVKTIDLNQPLKKSLKHECI